MKYVLTTFVLSRGVWSVVHRYILINQGLNKYTDDSVNTYYFHLSAKCITAQSVPNTLYILVFGMSVNSIASRKTTSLTSRGGAERVSRGGCKFSAAPDTVGSNARLALSPPIPLPVIIATILQISLFVNIMSEIMIHMLINRCLRKF